jgi:hypothetical protein
MLLERSGTPPSVSQHLHLARMNPPSPLSPARNGLLAVTEARLPRPSPLLQWYHDVNRPCNRLHERGGLNRQPSIRRAARLGLATRTREIIGHRHSKAERAPLIAICTAVYTSYPCPCSRVIAGAHGRAITLERLSSSGLLGAMQCRTPSIRGQPDLHPAAPASAKRTFLPPPGSRPSSSPCGPPGSAYCHGVGMATCGCSGGGGEGEAVGTDGSAGACCAEGGMIARTAWRTSVYPLSRSRRKRVCVCVWVRKRASGDRQRVAHP